jgi:hypothetical protein
MAQGDEMFPFVICDVLQIAPEVGVINHCAKSKDRGFSALALR